MCVTRLEMRHTSKFVVTDGFTLFLASVAQFPTLRLPLIPALRHAFRHGVRAKVAEQLTLFRFTLFVLTTLDTKLSTSKSLTNSAVALLYSIAWSPNINHHHQQQHQYRWTRKAKHGKFEKCWRRTPGGCFWHRSKRPTRRHIVEINSNVLNNQV